MENINLENAKMAQELLEDTQGDLKNRLKALKKHRYERVKKIRFCGFSVNTLDLKGAQRDLKKLLRLVKRLEINEVNESYYFIYRGKEIESVETYKRCTGAYATIINSIGLEENVVFSECKTSVRALIQALSLILIDEE